MKIALVALPRPEDIQTARIAPPLPLGYVAALLEQQRHIVRIYDLALTQNLPLGSALAPLRAFRPHMIVVASQDPAATAQVEAALADCNAVFVPLGISLREPAPGHAVAQVLWRIDAHRSHQNEQSVIFEALMALDDDLDSLPFPARHLLPLEQYSLFTTNGEIQTVILPAQQIEPGVIIPRQASLIVAEIESIVQEHGIRHFLFPHPPLTHNLAALDELLQRLGASALDARWEAHIAYQEVQNDLLQRVHRAGCEALCFEFQASDVFSQQTRAAISAAVAMAHEAGIAVRAHIYLEPPYDALTSLVDVSATFGIDAVHFDVRQPVAKERERVVGDGLTFDEVAEMARTRYRSSRSRQFFIDRFGPQLGPMLWRVGRAGLLGRTWRRYASGGEDHLVAV